MVAIARARPKKRVASTAFPEKESQHPRRIISIVLCAAGARGKIFGKSAAARSARRRGHSGAPGHPTLELLLATRVSTTCIDGGHKACLMPPVKRASYSVV